MECDKGSEPPASLPIAASTFAIEIEVFISPPTKAYRRCTCMTSEFNREIRFIGDRDQNAILGQRGSARRRRQKGLETVGQGLVIAAGVGRFP